MGQYVDAEVKSAVGRADVVVRLADAVYVFEFKYDGTPDEALAQIDSKQYALPFKADGRKENKIVAIGNPMENPNVKKFYLKILTGKEQEKSAVQTKVEISTQELDLGTFPKEEQRTGEILFKNVGDKPLIIRAVEMQSKSAKCSLKVGDRIEKGAKHKVTFEFDSAGCDYGIWVDRVKIITNDPSRPMQTLRLTAIVVDK